MAQSGGHIVHSSEESYAGYKSSNYLFQRTTKTPSNNSQNMNNFGNMFPPDNSANQAGGPRLAPSLMQAQQANGNGVGMNGMNVGMPMSAGQQMDVNLLYQKVVELSEVLKENREKAAGIVAGAEELAVSPTLSNMRWSILA